MAQSIIKSQSKIEQFKAMTTKEGLRCTFCHSQELLEVIIHEYKASGAMLKYTYFCKACQITVDGYVY